MSLFCWLRPTAVVESTGSETSTVVSLLVEQADRSKDSCRAGKKKSQNTNAPTQIPVKKKTKVSELPTPEPDCGLYGLCGYSRGA
jgi:hypothetical protein